MGEVADFYSPYRLVTLNIKSRSPKSNQLFIVSQCYNIKFRPESIILFKRQ